MLDHDWRRRPARVVAAMVAWPFATIGWNALVLYLGEHILMEIAFQTPSGDTSLVYTWLSQFVADHGDRGALLPGLWLLAVLFAMTAAMRALKWRVTL